MSYLAEPETDRSSSLVVEPDIESEERSIRGNWRGGGHNSRGRARGWHTHPRTRDGRDMVLVPPPLGPKFSSVDLEDVFELIEWTHNKIEGCQYLASYNLTEGPSKTILVPGGPPMWTPSSKHMTLKPDNGEYYRDINAAHSPKYPMEPVVASIFAMNPDFNATEIDLVACGSTLGNLLWFASENPHSFSFTVHLVGQTVFLLRRDNSPDEKIENVHGYGHAFLEACTTWNHDLKDSVSHQRIIRYSFGDLDTVVRFEADGYLPANGGTIKGKKTPATPSLPAVEKTANPDHNIGALSLGPSQDKTKNESGPNEPLQIRMQGHSVPHPSILDIKTRASGKIRNDIMAAELPRLWVRQVKNFVLAFHQKGVFGSPEVDRVEEAVGKWEQNSTKALNRLAHVLKHIRSTAMSIEGGAFEVRGSESSTLHFHCLSKEHIEYSILPDALKKRWEGVRT